MRKTTISLSICVLICISCSDKPEEKQTYQLNGESTLYIINKTKDSLDFRIRDNTIWPEKANYDVGTLAPKEERLEVRKSQGINDFYLSISDQDFNLYARAGNRDTAIITSSPNGKVALSFKGDMSVVNEFLAKKSSYFNSYYSDRNGRSKYMIDAKNSLADIYQLNDSLTEENKTYILSHKEALPDWFVDFELKRLDYLNAWYKMNAVFYRVKTLNLKEGISDELIAIPYQDITTEDAGMLGNRDYMSFLYQYVSYKMEFDSEIKEQSGNSREVEIGKRLEVINDNLSGEVREAYLASELCQYIDRGLLYDSAWLTLVKDQKFRTYLGSVTSYYEDHH